MALSILTSKLQVIKTLKDHEYIQRLKDHDYMQTIHNAKRKITEGIQIGQSDNDQKNNRKSRAQLIRLSAAVCGIELCYSAETAFVSPILLKLGVPVQLMTLVWCLSPLLGLILVPVMGSLSDRCPLKLGRRRPFILIFSAGIIAGLVLVPNGETLGLMAGDKGLAPDPGTFNTTLNDTMNEYFTQSNLSVPFDNGTFPITRSSFTPEWLSVKLPNNHVIGILLTVIGVALLDFNCDACQSPCRTYLLDISVPEDHPRGLTSFTVMAGLGGSFGYLVGGIDWESTSFGAALGGHIRVVFTGVLFLFIICVILTVTSFRETPLNELDQSGQTIEKQQKKRKVVKKAKYNKFENESSEEESEEKETEHVRETLATYGSMKSQNQNNNGLVNEFEKKPVTNGVNGINSVNGVDGTHELNGINGDMNGHTPFSRDNKDIEANEYVDKSDQLSSDIGALVSEIPLRTYLRSIFKMPKSMQILCLTNLFSWMSLVCYSLYFTDFVGQSVYGGDPRAPAGSVKHRLYDDGVRLGSFGMSLYSLSCALYSMCVEYLVKKFSKCNEVTDVLNPVYRYMSALSR